jgi:hypothetical protein
MNFSNLINKNKKFTSRHFFIALSISSFFSLGQSALLKQSIRLYGLEFGNKIFKIIPKILILDPFSVLFELE